MKTFFKMGLMALGLCASYASAAFAQADDASDANFVAKRHLGTELQQRRAQQWNTVRADHAPQTWNVLRPFSEMEHSGFVAITADDGYELPQLREAIAKNLPSGVSLIIFTSDEASISNLQAEYGQYLGDRLKFVIVPEGGDPDWARDSLPFPVYLKTDSPTPSFGLVASIYPQNFDPNQAVDHALGLPMVNTNQYFRGGNLLFDEQANCFAENVNEVAGLRDPDSFFKDYFGCATVTLLDHEGGIGDIDERLKFLPNKVVLTDNQNYADLLTQKGYTVKMIPSTGDDGETYMNTLYVNGTIFVPQMGIASDSAALDAYRALGFNPVGVYTKELADQGDGNIHCVTMNYPAGTFVQSTRNPAIVEFAQ